MVTIKLSVERISEDGLYGSTTNHKMMIKNGELAKQLIEKDKRYTPFFFKAGRFVAATIIERGQPLYCFFDFNKNIQTAIGIVQEYYKDKIDQADLFLYVFNQTTKRYEEDYNEVELVLDESFGQTFINEN